MSFLVDLNLAQNSLEEFPDADLENLYSINLSGNKLLEMPTNIKVGCHELLLVYGIRYTSLYPFTRL